MLSRDAVMLHCRKSAQLAGNGGSASTCIHTIFTHTVFIHAVFKHTVFTHTVFIHTLCNVHDDGDVDDKLTTTGQKGRTRTCDEGE